MTKVLDNRLILNRIKSYYKTTKNTELAKVLAIKPNTLSNWVKRNSIDLELIITSCEELNPNWIINGEGRPKKTVYNLDETSVDIANDAPGTYGAAGLVEEIDRLSKIVALQEATISAQAKTILVMEKLIAKS